MNKYYNIFLQRDNHVERLAVVDESRRFSAVIRYKNALRQLDMPGHVFTEVAK